MRHVIDPGTPEIHQIPLPDAGDLGEYIPFYFGGHSPMLYLIMKGYKGVQQRPQEDIVFLISTYQTVEQAGLEFVFTDRNAKLAFANFYNEEQYLDQIQWDVVKSRVWKNDESSLNRQDYKQAEFLVRNYMPVNCLTVLVTKNEAKKRYFEELMLNLSLDIPVYQDKTSKLYY